MSESDKDARAGIAGSGAISEMRRKGTGPRPKENDTWRCIRVSLSNDQVSDGRTYDEQYDRHCAYDIKTRVEGIGQHSTGQSHTEDGGDEQRFPSQALECLVS